MRLAARQLFQTVDYESPFDPELEGFTAAWWFGHSHHLTHVPDVYLSFEFDGAEVARAHLDPEAQVDDIYVGFTPPLRVVDIVFFEVRADCRLRGVGRAALDLIEARYAGRVLVAFSMEADGFWRRTNFSYRPRRDPSPLYSPLFVKRARE